MTGKNFKLTFHPTGETDWKILAINVNDPLAENLNGGWRTPYPSPTTGIMNKNTVTLGVIADIADIREYMPGFLEVQCPL